MKLTYYKSLDGVRAIAALMVMFSHFFAQYFSLHPGWAKITVLAQSGVTLFFVLSGFLITRILLVAKTKPGYFKNFYIKRTLRIFPLYYFFLVVFYFLLPLITHSQATPFKEQVYYWTYLQNFAMTFNWPAVGPEYYWSLAVEEHFYLFWPLVVLLLSLKNLRRVSIFICLFAIGLRYIMINKDFDVYYFTFTRFDSLAIGALLATLETGNILVSKSRRYFTGILIITLPLMVLLSKFSGEGAGTIQVIKYSIFSLAFMAIIALLIDYSPRAIANRILSSPFFSYSGKISYGLYVWHPTTFLLCTTYMQLPVAVMFFISFGMAYLFASLSYYLLEKRFLDWKQRFNESKAEAKLDVQAESF